MMHGSKIIRLVLAVILLMAPRALLSQDSGTKPASSADQPAPPAGPAGKLKNGEPQVSTTPREQIFQQLVAPPDEPAVDIVRFRLLRNEIPRWMRLEGIIDEDSFDDWAFGGEQGEKRFRDQLDTLLETKLQVIDRVLLLNEPQRRKLKLAGRGDIKHLLDMVDGSRRSSSGLAWTRGACPNFESSSG